MLDHVWLFPVIPTVSFLIILFFGKKLPKQGAEVGITALGALFLLACVVAAQWIDKVESAGHGSEKGLAALGHSVVAAAEGAKGGGEVEPIVHGVTWWQNGTAKFVVGTRVDGMVVMMLLVVTIISLLVHVYSTAYMHDDRRFTYYYAALSLFTASMLLLVVSANLLQLVVGWELVGLCSYMLIGHWWEEKENSDAALKAFLTTRTGDVGLMIGVIVCFFAANSFDIAKVNEYALSPHADHGLLLVALADRERGLGQYEVHLHEDALEFLAETSDGDARRALSALEVGVLSCPPPVEFTRQLAEESVQRKAIEYDRLGDAHYDSISALIKSIRGSDPDAALYWLARMLEGGEDVRFLARRLVILASEDVGNADPQGLVLAVAAAQACELVGLPECQLNLAQAVTYLACAPKSNAATIGIGEARRDVREGRLLPVPVHLRGSSYAGAKRLGHGKGYQYAHDYEGGVAPQDYLGVQREYYRPTDRGFEAELAKRLEAIRKQLRAGR